LIETVPDLTDQKKIMAAMFQKKYQNRPKIHEKVEVSASSARVPDLTDQKKHLAF
jgi:hypothetical protein